MNEIQQKHSTTTGKLQLSKTILSATHLEFLQATEKSEKSRGGKQTDSRENSSNSPREFRCSSSKRSVSAMAT